MAQYSEVERGKSSVDEQSEEIDLRKMTALLITPTKDGGVKVTEHFEQHKPETTEYAENEAEEFIDHIKACCLADEEGSESEE